MTKLHAHNSRNYFVRKDRILMKRCKFSTEGNVDSQNFPFCFSGWKFSDKKKTLGQPKI